MIAILTSLCKRAALLVLLAAGLGLTACDDIAISTGGPSIDTSKPVPVALLVPRGSGQPGDAVLAEALENAARMAIGDLKGVNIDLRVYDTAAKPDVAAAKAREAVQAGARIILGPVYAQVANAAGVAVRGRNVNVLAFSNNPAIAGGNVFILGPTFANTAARLARFAADQGKGKIVIAHGTDASGLAGKAAIEKAISTSPATLAGVVPYELTQEAVIAAVAPIRDMVESTGATTLFLTATTSADLPLLSQLLPEAGLKTDKVQYVGLTRWDIPPQTLELPGVQGGWFALPDPGLDVQFRKRYAQAFGGTPHPIGSLAYDGIAAIGALVGAGRADALTGAALTQAAGFQGVGGIFRLLPDGTNERGLAIATIQNSQVAVIDPAPRSFSGSGS